MYVVPGYDKIWCTMLDESYKKEIEVNSSSINLDSIIDFIKLWKWLNNNSIYVKKLKIMADT